MVAVVADLERVAGDEVVVVELGERGAHSAPPFDACLCEELVRVGGGRSQFASVRVLRVQDHVVGGAVLHDAALVEDHDLVAEVAGGRQVVVM